MNATILTRLSLVLGSLIVVALVALLLGSGEQSQRGFGGNDGKIGGDFTLSSADGDVSLEDLRGKVVVLYFGFLSCPKVCPTSMGVLKNALLQLDKEKLTQVQGVLVSIDPKRDSLQELAAFTQKFHPNIIGLTSTEEVVDALSRNYGAFFTLTEAESPDADDYAFRHSSRYYLIDQNGKLVDAMRHSTTANELHARLDTLIQRS